MKDKVKATPICNTPKPLKIKEGRVQIILEDKAGNKEVVADHNMQTDALAEYLADCGWLNRDNAPQDNLVPELLGGIMLLNDTLDEDADITHIPAGVQMIANGALGTTNTGTPYELGSCSAIATETGWQADGSYLQTYRWDENHGNCPSGQSIKSVVLTSKAMGYCGCGNQSGASASGSDLFNSYYGSISTYRLGPAGSSYITAHVSIVNSEAYYLDLSDIGNNKVTINKCRIPTRKVNLKGSTSSPVILDTQEVTISDSDLASALVHISYGRVYGARYYDAYNHFWIFNVPESGSTWGTNYTQYLWDFDVTTGTATKYTILNASGDTLHGMLCPVFVDTTSGTTVFFIDGYQNSGSSYSKTPGTIYKFEIASGTVGSMTSFSNNTGRWGAELGNSVYPRGASQDGKVIIGSQNNWSGGNPTWCIVDGEDNTCLPVNIVAGVNIDLFDTDIPSVKYCNRSSSGSTTYYCSIMLYRHIDYIATIFNCPTAYTKDATKTMTVVYRLTFEEEEEENE